VIPGPRSPIINLYKATLAAYTNTTPADGDLWFDGTDLKFRKGRRDKNNHDHLIFLALPRESRIRLLLLTPT
jgi:hypothetical protein